MAVREGNNVLGVYACDADKPPVAIRYLEDPEAPGAQLLISPNGKKYTVNKDFETFSRFQTSDITEGRGDTKIVTHSLLKKHLWS